MLHEKLITALVACLFTGFGHYTVDSINAKSVSNDQDVQVVHAIKRYFTGSCILE